MKSSSVFFSWGCRRQGLSFVVGDGLGQTAARSQHAASVNTFSAAPTTTALVSSLSATSRACVRRGVPAFAVSVHAATRCLATSAPETSDDKPQGEDAAVEREHGSQRARGNGASRSSHKKKGKTTRRRKKKSQTSRPTTSRATAEGENEKAAASAASFSSSSGPQPFSRVPRPPSMAEARAAVVGEGEVDAEDATIASEDLSAEGTPASTSMGWSYDDLDPQTGQTRLDKLYESQLARIHTLMSQPLPPLPADGSLNPDFFLGFAHYHYRLRDEYRMLVARELDVPTQAVRLSVAWSGRFNVSHFNRVQKVCGVFLDRDVLADTTPAPTRKASTLDTPRSSASASSSSPPPLPEATAARVQQFVKLINQRQSERLLSAQLVQASDAIPEVEFAMTRREQQQLAQLHHWLHRHVLQTSLAVLVVGGNELYRYAASSAAAGGAVLVAPRDVIMRAVTKDAEEAARQTAYVAHHWLKMFHNRQVVPRVLPVAALAARLAEAVVRADVSLTPPSSASSSDDLGADGVSERGFVASLPPPVAAFVQALAAQLRATPTDTTMSPIREMDNAAGITGEDARYADGFDTLLRALGSETTTTTTTTATTTKAAEASLAGAVSWWRLCREALLFQQAPSPTTTNTTTTNAAEHDADVFYRFSNEKMANRGDLPAAFVHGAFLGGVREMQYLQHNRAAMDAVVLHPNDVDFKKKFARRMKSGHSRLQMEAEAKSPYTDN